MWGRCRDGASRVKGLNFQTETLPATLDDLHGQLEIVLGDAVSDAMKEMPDIYARYFTASEINELAKFYKTPLGAKMLIVLPRLQSDMMPLIMQAGPSFERKIDATFADTLRRRGYR
jgi:hypothetical protein